MVKGTLAYSIRLNGQRGLFNALHGNLQVINQLH
jgi:hypothetical protein